MRHLRGWGFLKQAPCAPAATPSLDTVTFSISCLNVVNTSLLLERVFWNSSNFSVYRASWVRKKPRDKIRPLEGISG